jgi:Mn-dependent DtxR family transcriptional regulator
MVAERNEAKFLVRRIAELLRSWDEMVEEDKKRKLREYGYDSAALATRGAEFAKQLFEQQRQRARGALRAERLAAQSLADRTAEQLEFKVPADVEQAIKEIQAGRYGADCQKYVQTYFRNLEKASLQDKIRLLRDIKLLSELQKKKGSEPPSL